MSGDYKSPNPFGEFGSSNPYATPMHSAFPPPGGSPQVKNKVMPPAIAMLVAAVIGLAASLFNFAFSFTEPVVDPAAPPFLQEMQKGAAGPVTSVIQGAFIVVNSLIIFGAAQMLRCRTWGLALMASILSMVNFGTCCCILGLPFGIWSLVVLVAPDVKLAFASK
jgi:hypothetical protein